MPALPQRFSSFQMKVSADNTASSINIKFISNQFYQIDLNKMNKTNFPRKSLLSQANEYMRRGEYKFALDLYQEISQKHPELRRHININIDLIKNKINSSLSPEILKNKHTLNNLNLKTFKNFQDQPEFWNNFEIHDFGAAFLGPIFAFFFSNFLNELKKQKIKKLWFLSREGYFLEQAFKYLCKEFLHDEIETHYIYCSRAFLFKLCLPKKKLWPEALQSYYKGNLISLLKGRYMLPDEDINIINIISSKFRNNKHLHIELPKDFDLILNILEDAEDYLIKKFTPKFLYYIEYLKSINFGSSSVEHLVDIGYSGTIQKLLTELTDTSTHGHYFFITSKAIESSNKKFSSYITKSDFGKGNLLLDKSLYLESILTAPHGQVIDIYKNENDKICFKFGPLTNAQKNFDKLSIIIEGAIKYASESIRMNNIMNINELIEYFSNFIANKALFPDQIAKIMEIDDFHSGNNILNPLHFF